VVRFADGTSAQVFRETVAERGPARNPCVLVVEFRLRAVRGWGHAAFRRESLLNTPLFAGFPGFVSKLWLAHDDRGRYRGLYEWDDPLLAEGYARALWRGGPPGARARAPPPPGRPPAPAGPGAPRGQRGEVGVR